MIDCCSWFSASLTDISSPSSLHSSPLSFPMVLAPASYPCPCGSTLRRPHCHNRRRKAVLSLHQSCYRDPNIPRRQRGWNGIRRRDSQSAGTKRLSGSIRVGRNCSGRDVIRGDLPESSVLVRFSSNPGGDVIRTGSTSSSPLSQSRLRLRVIFAFAPSRSCLDAKGSRHSAAISNLFVCQSPNIG